MRSIASEDDNEILFGNDTFHGEEMTTEWTEVSLWVYVVVSLHDVHDLFHYSFCCFLFVSPFPGKEE